MLLKKIKTAKGIAMTNTNAEYQHNEKWCTAAQLLERYNISTMHQALGLLSRFAAEFPMMVTGSDDMMCQVTNPMRIRREYLPRFKKMYALHEFADLQKISLLDLQSQFPNATLQEIEDSLRQFYSDTDTDKTWVYKYQLPELSLLIEQKIELRIAQEREKHKQLEQKLAALERERLALEREQNILAHKRAVLERIANEENERQQLKQYWAQNRIATVSVLLKDYMFDVEADEDALEYRIRRFGTRFPDAVKYGPKGMCGLCLDYMDEFLKFSGWKLLKVPGGDLMQPTMEPGLPGYGTDKSLDTVPDDEINSYILHCMSRGIDGSHKDTADIILSMVSSNSSSDNLSYKTRDWLSCAELVEIFVIDYTTLLDCLKKMRAEMPFSIEPMQTVNHRVALCLRRNALAEFAQKSGLKYRNQIPEKGDEWLVATDLIAMFHGHGQVIRKTLKELQLKKSPFVQEVRTSTSFGLALHKNGIDAFIEEALKNHWHEAGANQKVKQRFIQMANVIKANNEFENIRAQTQAKLQSTDRQID